ncbi:FoF1 ATP synthase subunit a [Oerskovia sp. M15]
MKAWSYGVPNRAHGPGYRRPLGVHPVHARDPSPFVAAAEGEGGFHAPTIGEFFPDAILFAGTPFEFNRLQLIRVIATIVVLAIFMIAARRAKLVPGRFQNGVEMVLDFARVSIVEEIMGTERARRYVPMITTIFVTILAFNLTGVVPGLNLSGTSVAGVAILLALWVFVAYWAAGIRQHGLWGYIKANLFPGRPVPDLLHPGADRAAPAPDHPPGLAGHPTDSEHDRRHIMLVLCFAATNFLLLEAAPHSRRSVR